LKVSYNKKSPVHIETQIVIPLNENFLTISDTKFILEVKEGSKKIFFEGEIYYHIKGMDLTLVRKDEYPEFLRKKLRNFDLHEFVSSVEGIYNGIYIDADKNEVIIFCDYLNRKNFYYTQSSDNLTASTCLDNIIPELNSIKYNQQALLSYLTIGYTPVYQTFYEGISRFNNNEYIKIVNGNVEHSFFTENYSIGKYDKFKLEEYDSLISNSVLSRSSGENFVLNSGGWDSTSIIYQLTKAYESGRINSVICETKLRDGKSFNIYEVDKVKRISEYFGIKSDIIDIDFNDKKLISDWESIKKELKNYHTYFFVDMPKAVNEVSLRNGNSSIYSGEASDSIHNFGFSQFVSVTYNNNELREYGDKMKSYLFSPSFYSKVLDGTFIDDKIYQFFMFYYGDDCLEGISNLDKAEILSFYFKSFMLSGERIPFARVSTNSFCKNSLLSEYNKNLSTNIFSDVVMNAKHENLYYHLLQLYRSYHFHSPQIESKHSAIRSSGKNCKIPFLDMSLLKFMYSMPENWGRGLELKPTKYPLRYLANEKWNMPIDILNEAGAHSYISECDSKWNYSGGKWNMYCETIYNSVFGDYYKSLFSEVELEKYFSPDCFDIVKMKQILNDFINGKQDLENSGFIYKLGILFFIGLYEN